MDSKHMDAYILIDKAILSGIVDETEIIKLLQEFLGYSEDGAILALSSYQDNQKRIKDYIKKNNLTSEKNVLQLGE